MKYPLQDDKTKMLKVNKLMISKFRNPDADVTGDPAIPTPEEFIKFVLDQLISNQDTPEKIDAHWRPQHYCCPFCLLNFSVYSFIEDSVEDSLYFFQKSGLQSKLDPHSQQNVRNKTNSSEKR